MKHIRLFKNIVDYENTLDTLYKLKNFLIHIDGEEKTHRMPFKFKYEFIVGSDWSVETKYGLDWILLETISQGRYRVGSNGTSVENFQKSDILEVIHFPKDLDGRTNLNYLFSRCYRMTKLDVTKWDTSKVTSMYCAFQQISAPIDVSNFDMSNVTNIGDIFDLSPLSRGYENWTDMPNLTNANGAFYGNNQVTSIDLSKWNVPNLVNCYGIFGACSKLNNVVLFNSNKHIYSSKMFYSCVSLKYIDLSPWQTTTIGGTSWMFQGCTNLEEINWGTIETITPTIDGMFLQCNKLKSVKALKCTYSGQTMRYHFQGCSTIKTLDLSNYKTSSITNFSDLFRDCTSLVTLDLSGWDMTRATSMSDTFLNCNSLKDIYAYSCSQTTIDIIKEMMSNANMSNTTLHTSYPSITEGLVYQFDGHNTWYESKWSGMQNDTINPDDNLFINDENYKIVHTNSNNKQGKIRPSGGFSGRISGYLQGFGDCFSLEWVGQTKTYLYWSNEILGETKRIVNLVVLDLSTTSNIARGCSFANTDGILCGYPNGDAIGDVIEYDGNRIHSYSLTYDKGHWDFYVDGELHCSCEYFVDLSVADNKIYVGVFPPYMLPTDYTYYSMRMYNRTLSSDDVKENYNKDIIEYGTFNYDIKSPFVIY